ncbi:MAG: hypothetical protein IJU55_05440, partial [Selenomonadaceae bacterium]|nr:hypothetical protein [Selenomonadaceae bacterium]
MNDEKLNWLMLAEKFVADGEFDSMRGVARELFELDKNFAEGPAIMAESALYLGNLDEAEILAQDALTLEKNNLRAKLILGGVAAERFQIKDEIKILGKIINDANKIVGNLKLVLNNYQRKFKFSRSQKNSDDDEKYRQIEMKFFLANKILYKALCWISNGLYLSGEPNQAAEALRDASTLADTVDKSAELYSKHLFLKNYREIAPQLTKELAKNFNNFFVSVNRYSHAKKNISPEKKLRIGYISPDFRNHAVANFVLPFMKNFDSNNFSVFCYQTGKSDAVTERLKKNKVTWRNLSGRNNRTAARIISEDKIDILVDLSGHSQNSCLPIMAVKPAPIQMTAIGYTATTGLKEIDYFLSDKICVPDQNSAENFTEEIIRLENCNLCYAPGVVREIPTAGKIAPVMKNNFVTFGSFNNFAKVTDEILNLWRAILEKIPDSILVIKSKICSIEQGGEIVRERLQKIGFSLKRIELRPYSPDYLEQYRDIDIALDTFPYTGGATTCEALYMGVPVISLRGKSHGSKFGESILTAADLHELIAKSPMDYIKKAVHMG